MPLTYDKSKSKPEALASNKFPFLTEVQLDLSNLSFVQVRIITIQ